MGAKVEHAPATGFYPNPMTGADSSIGTITFPNGFIEKWGQINCAAAGNTIVTFATAFPNACFQIIACFGSESGNAQTLTVHTISTINFNIHNYCADIRTVRWFARGR